MTHKDEKRPIWKTRLGGKYLFHNAFNIGFTLLLYKLSGFQIALLLLLAAISTDVGEIMKEVYDR